MEIIKNPVIAGLFGLLVNWGKPVKTRIVVRIVVKNVVRKKHAPEGDYSLGRMSFFYFTLLALYEQIRPAAFLLF